MTAPVGKFVPQTQPPSGAPNMNFAAPPPGRTNWGPTPFRSVWSGYAQPLSQEPGGTPDPMRTMQMPQRQDYPAPGDPRGYYYGAHGVANDEINRRSVETEQATPWQTPTPQVNRFAPNPRWTPAPEYRPTQRMSPASWSFTRPFDQRMARRFNGNHFSMADHRRNYPVFGMAPRGAWRNIDRTDPAPWDSNLTIKSPQPQYAPNPQVPVYEVPLPNRGWVMG